MTFPLDLECIRTLTEETYAGRPEEIKDAPPGFQPLDDILHWLTEKEKSFLVHENKLYLNWGELELASVFDAALDALRDGDTESEDISAIHCVAGIFRHEGPTLQSLGDSTDYEEWAVISLLQAIEQLVGYNTECGDYLIGFTLEDLEQSYEAYSRDIAELPDFHEELRTLMGANYESALEHMRSLSPEPVAA
jgi:hypothetical protein